MGEVKATALSPESEGSGKKTTDDHHWIKEKAKKSYFLTRSLGEKFQRFSALGLKVPAPDAKIFVVDTINELINKLNSVLAPTANVTVRAQKDMAEDIIAKASRFKLGQRSNIFQDTFSVSTCPEIANLRDGGSLYINRIIDDSGEVIGIGPRPGASSIEDQFSAICNIAEGRPIIIIEDGSFTGGTMKFILQEMNKREIKVNALVIGLVFPKAQKELSGVFDGEIIACDDADNYLDWMPDHDFFPFTPGSGRVFGLSWRGNPIPLYSRKPGRCQA
jgi:hypothetical protein